MNVLLLRKNQLSAFVAALLERYRVIAPVRRDGELRFDAVATPGDVVLDYRNTVKAPKAVLFPQTECMIRFQRHLDQFNEVEAVPLNGAPTVVLGIRVGPMLEQSVHQMVAGRLDGRHQRGGSLIGAAVDACSGCEQQFDHG